MSSPTQEALATYCATCEHNKRNEALIRMLGEALCVSWDVLKDYHTGKWDVEPFRQYQAWKKERGEL